MMGVVKLTTPQEITDKIDIRQSAVSELTAAAMNQ
jgi:hypothetical protein